MISSLVFCCLVLFRLDHFAAEAPHIYGIHDHDPFPGEFLTHLESGNTRGWVTATVGVGANTNDFSGADFSAVANRGHSVICRINYGYYPDGTIPVSAKWDDFARRCANFVQNSSGCTIWLIANETNLSAEWPFDGVKFAYVSPQDYAVLFRKVYNAIKAVRPEDKILPQALAPWAGPYGGGQQYVPAQNANFPSDGNPLNWVTYLNQMLTAIAASGPLDGIALHIGSRGYAYSDIHSTHQINAGGQNLYFSFYNYKDWVDYGIPQSLWHLPLYATECNGMYFWKGGHPEDPAKHYEPGWMQEIFAEINRYNQVAATAGKPIYRCVNFYRWCAFCDGWNMDGASNPYKAQILSDLDVAVAQNYTWPTNTTPTNPPAAPVNVTASVGFGNVALKWNPVPGATGYRIKRYVGAAVPIPNQLANFTNLAAAAYIDTSYSYASTFTNYYCITATNAVGESPLSTMVVAKPTNAAPDVIVTTVSWTPTNAGPGTNVVFRATVRNKGSGATPAGTTLGVGFHVNGGQVAWSGSHTSALAKDAAVTLTADGGPAGINYWTATPGAHVITAVVDDINRFPEGDEGNNGATTNLGIYVNGYALNSGGTNSGSFAADGYFAGSTSTFSVTNQIETNGVTGAAPQAVYQTERWNDFAYTLPYLIPNKAYTVRLHFAEISPSVTAAGHRRFHVAINGTQVLTNFDIFATANGKSRANIQEFTVLAPSSGEMVVEFIQGDSNEPKVSGIEVIRATIVPPPRVLSTTVSNNVVTLTWQTSPGKTYRVEFKSSLSDTGWTTFGSDLLASGGSLSSTNSAGGNSQRFYRIVQVD